jgi:hypothetical protein
LVDHANHSAAAVERRTAISRHVRLRHRRQGSKHRTVWIRL